MNAWKSFAIVSMTGNQPAWEIDSLSLAPLVFQDGYDHYTQGLTTWDIPSLPGMKELKGYDAIRCLARFNAACFWHWPGSQVLAAIRAISVVGTKLGVIVPAESIPQKQMWSSIQQLCASPMTSRIVNGGQPWM